MSETPDHQSSRLSWLLVVPAAVLVLFVLTGPIVSGDLWWHLSTGEWMLDYGELPEHDPFSHTVGDKPWTLEEYGAQILFALVHRAGGLEAIRVVGGLLGLLVLLVAYRTARRELPPFWATALTALFALLFALKWELRPHLLSVFFFFRLQHLLFPSRHERDPGAREWIEVFLLTVVWVQLHGEGIFVPTLAIAGLIGAIVVTLRESLGHTRRIRAWVVVLVVAAIGSLCSPEGLDQVRYAVSESSIPRALIGEWLPLWTLPGDVRFTPVTVSLFYTTVISAVIGAWFVVTQAVRKLSGTEVELSWERIGLLASCVLLAIIARRFFWLLYFPMIDALVLYGRARPALLGARVTPAVLALLFTAILTQTHNVGFGKSALEEGDWRENINSRVLPHNATRFASDVGLTGNLFHRYEFGGFLGFHLWPDCRVYLDGRTVLFAEIIPERWKLDYWRTEETLPGEESAEAFARRTLNEREVNIIVMPTLVEREGQVRKWDPPGAHKEWIRVWEDGTSIVWLRATDTENLQRIVEWYGKYNIEFDPSRGFVESQVLDAQADWIHERGLLTRPVRELLGPHLAGEDLASTFSRGGMQSVQLWLQLGMGRSARWSLEQALANDSNLQPEEYAAWMALLDKAGPAETYRRFAQGERR